MSIDELRKKEPKTIYDAIQYAASKQYDVTFANSHGFNVHINKMYGSKRWSCCMGAEGPEARLAEHIIHAVWSNEEKWKETRSREAIGAV